MLHRAARKPYLYVPKAGRLMHRPVGWLERRYGRDLLVGAARGVVIAAGGFGGSRELLRAHAPSARGGLPLATRDRPPLRTPRRTTGLGAMMRCMWRAGAKHGR